MTRRISSIALAVLADMVRRRAFYVVAFFAVVMTVAIPSLPSYGIGVVKAVFREVSLGLTYFFALALTVAVGATRVHAEIERRTIYNILAKNVRRWEYLVGTWLGIALFIGAAIACFTVVEQLVGFFTYGDPVWRLWQGSFAIWLEMGVLAAFAVAFSTLSGAVAGATATLTFLFIAHSRDALLTASAGPARALYPSLDTFNVINPVAHGTGITALYALVMIATFVGYAGVLLALGTLAFQKKDL